MTYDKSHGSPYDRGSADAYYRRRFEPHYYPQGTYKGQRITEESMTAEEVSAYRAGYEEQVESGDFKDWG